MHSDYVPCAERFGVARDGEAAAILAEGNIRAFGYLLHAVGEGICALRAGVYVSSGQNLRCVGEHDGHLAVRHGLLRHKLAVNEREPAAVDRDLRVGSVGHRLCVREAVRRALLELVAEAEVQRVRRKLTRRRLVRVQRRARLLIDQAELRRHHHVTIVAVACAYIAVIIIRIVVLLDCHVEGLSQLLQPLNARYLALRREALQRHERRQQYHRQHHA